MNRRVLLYLIGAVVVIGIGAMAYILLSGGTGEASAPISAPTLSLDEATATAADVADTPTSEATEEMAEPTSEATAEEPDTPAAATATPAADAGAASGGDSRILFRIVPDDSEVSFSLGEDLFGQPNEVVGRTNQVAGDLIVDLTNPANSELGTVRINVRTLQTDNEFRNRAIRGQILQSAQDQFEFAEFRPTALSGLPDSVAEGDTISFQIEGELQVRDISQTTTWDAQATLVSGDQIEGTATTTVTRTEYNLEIPSVPSVANVTDEVTLTINFVATRVTE
jgi:polyisoprenoid-binding protein YceI